LSTRRSQEIKTELKWLTNALAPAREMDVFVKERIEPIMPHVSPRRGARAVTQDFSARRAAAFDSRKREEQVIKLVTTDFHGQPPGAPTPTTSGWSLSIRTF
jgi:hypothetical protein